MSNAGKWMEGRGGGGEAFRELQLCNGVIMLRLSAAMAWAGEGEGMGGGEMEWFCT